MLIISNIKCGAFLLRLFFKNLIFQKSSALDSSYLKNRCSRLRFFNLNCNDKFNFYPNLLSVNFFQWLINTQKKRAKFVVVPSTSINYTTLAWRNKVKSLAILQLHCWKQSVKRENEAKMGEKILTFQKANKAYVLHVLKGSELTLLRFTHRRNVFTLKRQSIVS